MMHHLKLTIDFADAVLSGEKNFEIRQNDRGFQKGDRVDFTVVDRLGMIINHPLNDRVFIITYVLNGWGLKNGYCVFGIRKAWED